MSRYESSDQCDALVFFATLAHAQDFPARPLRMVIAFPPGGPTDIVGRRVAEKMGGSLGQSVIVDNRPGANGAIGAEYVAKSPADGYTLFMTTVGAVAVTPHRSTSPGDALLKGGPGVDSANRRS